MTTEQQTRWTIGQTVSRADAEAMPVGTVLQAGNQNYTLTKQADGRWMTSDLGTRLANTDLSENYNTLQSLPSQWTVGQVLTAGQAAEVPVGTVIRAPENADSYRRTDDGYRNVRHNTGNLTADLFNTGRYAIVSLPEASDSEVSHPRFTIGQVMSQADLAAAPLGTVLRDSGNHYQMRKIADGWERINGTPGFTDHFVYRNLANSNVLVSLPTRFVVGQRLTTNDDLADVPMGTVISAGASNASYRRVEGGYVNVQAEDHTLALNLFTAGVFSIVSLPDHGPSQSEDEWTVGQVLTDNEQFDLLPVGTVIVNEDGEHYEMLPASRNRRLDDGRIMDNDQRSARVCTYRIESLPGDPWVIGERLERGVARNLPVGSIVFQTGSPRLRYRRTTDGWEAIEGGHQYATHIIADSTSYSLESVAEGEPSQSEGEVGVQVRDLEHMQSLPIGTVLQYRSGVRYTVVSGHRLQREADDRHFNMEGRAYHRYQVESVPRFRVGQVLTSFEEFREVPEGTIIQHVRAERALYERVRDGYRHTGHGSTYGLDNFEDVVNDYRIHSVPDHTTEPEALEVTETFEQYVQRFRVTVLGAAQGSGVNLTPIHRGLQSLNAPDPEPSVGMAVHYYDEEFNLNNLPDGTVAFYTTEDSGQVTIVGWNGRGWELICGNGGYHQGPMKVVTLPDGETLDWVTQEATEDDARQIAEFKEAAKVFGRGAKSEQGWCGVYERTMQVMGIDA